jgi:hypothetical protein
MMFSRLNLTRPIRQLCNLLKVEVEKKFPKFSKIVVAGFIFLRFFNPSIAAPDKMVPNGSSSFVPN